MLRTKSFVRKTRRGGVLSVQREHYLRTDIESGLGTSVTCQGDVPLGIPDTNIVLHQIDLLEHPEVTK